MLPAMTVGDWSSLVSTAVAVVAAIVSAVAAIRSRKSKVEANQHAIRTIKAAERAAAESARTALASERTAAAQEIEAELAASWAGAEDRAPWLIDPISSSERWRTCWLTNKSRRPKYNVIVISERIGGIVDFPVIHGGDRVLLHPSMREEPSNAVEITWTRRNPSMTLSCHGLVVSDLLDLARRTRPLKTAFT